MAKCKFKTDDGWECPLDAEQGKDYCYWHKREDGKSPNKNKLEVLRKEKIKGVYLDWAHLQEANLDYADLKEANLRGAHLQGANLNLANLEGSNLRDTSLKGANLGWTILERANLEYANLERAYLDWGHLKGANLEYANLKGACLLGGHLKGANLEYANLKGADFSFADLEGSNLEGTKVDEKTDFTGTSLNYSNLSFSYIDGTKTLRNAKFDSKTEINEIVADLLKKKDIKLTIPIMKKNLTLKRVKTVILDAEVIEGNYPALYEFLRKEGVQKYATYKKFFFFNKEKKCFEKHPGECIKTEKTYNAIRPKIAKNLDEHLLESSKEVKKDLIIKLYEASYDVFNMLYYFYIQNGKLEKAFEMHRKRSDVRRKLLMAKGGLKNKIRAILYDWFILKFLTGYGLNVFRPILLSFLTIITFTMLFWTTGGIVKRIDNIYYKPDFWDYLYHSVITFTSLGYSNIVPNLKIGHLAQGLVAAESILGVFLIALIIFTITYRISK